MIKVHKKLTTGKDMPVAKVHANISTSSTETKNELKLCTKKQFSKCQKQSSGRGAGKLAVPRAKSHKDGSDYLESKNSEL